MIPFHCLRPEQAANNDGRSLRPPNLSGEAPERCDSWVPHRRLVSDLRPFKELASSMAVSNPL